MLNIKAISSMEKVMPGSAYEDFPALESIKAARGERISLQLLVETLKGEGRKEKENILIFARLAPASLVTVDKVDFVPAFMPAYNDRSDDDYITKEPGLFPDVLIPVAEGETVATHRYKLNAFWITLDIPVDAQAGNYPLELLVTDTKGEKYELILPVEIKNVVLPKSDLRFTQWFHCDSIADYFGVEMMSEKHWELIEEFIKTAARTGINMLLTPLFTPPLDTKIGGERPTMQLVGVTAKGEDYTFDFSALDRWVDLCRKYGITYFEMSHLFTQWGVTSCPKIVVETENGAEKRFGWHVAAGSDLYRNFLSQLLPELSAHLKELGIADNCYFHISDEPAIKPNENRNDLPAYKSAKEFVKPLLSDFKFIDALSNIDFYEQGLVDIPIPATNHITPFLDKELPERWCYYCCGQGELVGNRFFAMPSYRNRILGVQMYLSNMDGFLQWGYNFYYTANAVRKINPYLTSDGGDAWPAGDPYSVYPYENGAIESIRTKVFYDGLQDRMLLKLLEEKLGKEGVCQLVEEMAGMKIDFATYPRDNDFLPTLHDTVLDILG